eukprot:CAMPEP_0117004560 /NCGR_PEP_ID=MMETSP0472-20121206/5484_1 /TAXON_ID=693140 ORGANISM="Tiarina fusus, Strain LIS" /NCGR_SAMPLE_ID=MMETSP0472 /ASSEMBLY_ACC=CAM_ASM_000603 /LENGTH=547 /DNA_ID=CAMNT_0004705539 /DNA_START=69 /DNA_END=1712 /DNA_ORIENTATION=-
MADPAEENVAGDVDDDEDNEIVDRYYDFFDQHTNNGRLLEVDISTYPGPLPPKLLTDEEAAARESWQGLCRDTLRPHYRGSNRIVNSSSTLLCERVCPPKLVIQNASTRYKSAGRRPMNPSQIHAWQNFRADVSAFAPADKENNTLDGEPDDDVFMRSLNARSEAREEKQEEWYLIERVLYPLRDAGLIQFPSSQHVPRIGLPDLLLTEGEGDELKATMAVENKATHSLPLPMSSVQVATAHNIGRAETEHAMGDSYRERVCNPIGQLLRYMIQNGLRVGALSSATRTYFVLIQDEGDNVAGNVCISDAWFVGEENYLRAWAYCYDLSTQLENYESEAVSWASADSGQEFVLANADSEESDDDSDNSAGGGSGGATRDSPPSKRAKVNAPGSQLTSTLIPTVPVSSFSLEKALGYGRNGCVFRACWEGKEVAVKQFDLGVPGVYKRAKNEIRAYEKLRDCQGILVPKALFLSRSKFGVFFLGLQQGRMPGVDDDVSNWGNVLLRLHRDYGFLHEDAEGRNGIFIQDGRGKERLVAIDLEESKFVGQW